MKEHNEYTSRRATHHSTLHAAAPFYLLKKRNIDQNYQFNTDTFTVVWVASLKFSYALRLLKKFRHEMVPPSATDTMLESKIIDLYLVVQSAVYV